jgi:hypothetical protein
MNIIYEKTGVRYHEVHIYRSLHKWKFSPKVARKRFVNAASNEEREQFKKKAKEIISRIPKDFTVAVEDESIFIHDALVRRRMWTPEGTRPIVTVTGSHQRTCVFGTITIDGKQFFRQYDVFNQYAFLKYLKELQRKFRKLLLFIESSSTSQLNHDQKTFGRK